MPIFTGLYAVLAKVRKGRKRAVSVPSRPQKIKISQPTRFLKKTACMAASLEILRC